MHIGIIFFGILLIIILMVATLVNIIKFIVQKQWKNKWVVIFLAGLILFFFGRYMYNSFDTDMFVSDEKKVERNLEIITRTGHPTYYGSVRKAHEIWDDVKRGLVIFPDSHRGGVHDTIIVIETGVEGVTKVDKSDDLIRRLTIAFPKPMNVSLEEALGIAKEYMPPDIINKQLKFEESYCMRPIGATSDNEDTYYIISYGSYGGIVVIFYMNEEGSVDCFHIKDSGIPNWMRHHHLEQNKYKEIRWKYNFAEHEYP